MFSRQDYIKLLAIIEADFKDVDPQTAFSLCRELSLIYSKYMLGLDQPNIPDRLRSIIRYIKKTLPMEASDFITQIEKIIFSLENPIQEL